MGEFVDKVKGAVNDAIGNVKQESDNPETRADGDRQELKGEAQKKVGTVKGALGDDI